MEMIVLERVKSSEFHSTQPDDERGFRVAVLVGYPYIQTEPGGPPIFVGDFVDKEQLDDIFEGYQEAKIITRAPK